MKQIKIFQWGHGRRYNDFPTFFRGIFQHRVQKIAVDAGFSCPNRDGSKGYGGCTYCNNHSFQPDYCAIREPITDQLQKGIDFFSKKYKNMHFLAYFQSYTNTYASVDSLIEIYEQALLHPKIVGLSIATRPDCLNDELLDYLKILSRKYFVMVELGLESHKNETLKAVNRGHTFEDSVLAIEQLAERGIYNCAHMILGLPGETFDDYLEQARVISTLPVNNLKLHQLQIHSGTIMAHQFAENPSDFSLFDSVDAYIDVVVRYLENLNPSIVVERFVSTSPANMLIAPRWGIKNFEFMAKLEKRLELEDSWQGKNWGK